ncbi:unnamed protein product [Wickerhamomyces anomalus]
MSDWDNVTIIGSKARVGGGGPRTNVARTQGQINAARRTGQVLETDVVAPKKIDATVGKTISKHRTEKKLSQKDLATKINEKPNVINDYEAGRAVPNQQVLGKLERALGVKLRGKNIGDPLFGPKK